MCPTFATSFVIFVSEVSKTLAILSKDEDTIVISASVREFVSVVLLSCVVTATIASITFATSTEDVSFVRNEICKCCKKFYLNSFKIRPCKNSKQIM